MLKKYILISIFIATSVFIFGQKNFHDFVVKDIAGNDYPLSQLKGKKVLVVNTASECGLTPQYEGLQDLFETYGDDEFLIIGFPANNFGKQEPGSNEEIAAFCSSRFHVTFPVMSKISVKGDDQHPLYKWLTTKDENTLEDSKVSWNFQKYMISEDGELLGHFSPQTKPDNKKIIKWIEE